MTVPFVDLVVVVTPSAEHPNCAEVLGFASEVLIEAFDHALAQRKRRNPQLFSEGSDFRALDLIKRGKVMTQGLNELSKWRRDVPRLGPQSAKLKGGKGNGVRRPRQARVRPIDRCRGGGRDGDISA